MKRHAHSYGRKGKGGHTTQPIYGRRVSKYARYIHEHGAEHGDAEAFARAVKSGCLLAGIISTLLCLAAIAANAQDRSHFEFNTSLVVTVDTSGNMEVLDTGLRVRAWADTLQAGKLKWWGITWTPTDGGDLYFISPRFRAHYRPGPGGQGLLICPEGRLRTIEFHEKQKIK